MTFLGARIDIPEAQLEGDGNIRQSGIHLKELDFYEEIWSDQDLLQAASHEVRAKVTQELRVPGNGPSTIIENKNYAELNFIIIVDCRYHLAVKENLESLADQYGLIYEEVPMSKIIVLEVRGWISPSMRRHLETIQAYLQS